MQEPDLKDLTDKPMVFPVFGRGRILEPLVGEGINDDNIAGMTYYLCGACSCQIKAQNPGTDLLFNVNWEKWLEGNSVIEDRELPPLSGIADIVGAPQKATEPEPEEEIKEASEETASDEPAQEETGLSPMGRNIAIMALLVMFGLAGATAIILRKNT